MKTGKPLKIGQLIAVKGKLHRIREIHPTGEIDVESLDGKRAWRVSGPSPVITPSETASCTRSFAQDDNNFK